MRLFWIFLGLALVVLLPFLIWGNALDVHFSVDGSVDWLRQFGAWAWLAGIALLASDLFLPIPGTAVMSALGYLYGTLLGGLIAATGSFISGIIGYALCRSFGESAAIRLLGEKDKLRGEKLFENLGGWIVAVSRALPLLAEVISCMAGLSRMKVGAFVMALLAGSLPMGFVFAAVGATGNDDPIFAVAVSLILPPVLWLALSRIIKSKTADTNSTPN